MTKDKSNLPPLQASLLRAMQAIDKQVSREMLRSPSETELHGVQKWEPYQKRVELVSSFILDSLGANECELDSLLVFSQAFSKALQIVAEDLGRDGLGDLRSSYTLAAAQTIEHAARSIIQQLRNGEATV